MELSRDYFSEPCFSAATAKRVILGPMPGTGVDAAKTAPAATTDRVAVVTGTPRLPPGYHYLVDVQLLDPAQEHHCFRRLNYLKYLADQSYSRGDRRRAGQFERQAQQQRNYLVEANLRLVFALAKRYSGGDEQKLDEFVSAGNATLMQAVERFDYRRGCRFSTYAYRAVQHAIFGTLRAARRDRQRFVGDGDAATAAAIKDAGASDVAVAEDLHSQTTVARLIDTLDHREQRIIRARFGFDRRRRPQAFHVIAKEIGLSTTRVVQLFQRAMKRLKTNACLSNA